ncbi:hypothetical protein D3C72_2117160 [compost metagenome]
MGWDRQAAQAQVADHVGCAPVEEDRPRRALEPGVGRKFAVQHQLREQGAVAPGQGLSADGLLAADDGPARLGRGRIARRRQGLDQAGLARTGPAGDDDALRPVHASRVAIIM